jgi:hypothetical protein
MPVSTKSLNQNLYDLLRSKGLDPIPLDSSGKQDIDIENADVYRFEFKDGDDEIGTGWVTLEDKELVFYIDDRLSDNDNFLNFMQFVKRWSQRRLLGFKITNRDNLTSDMKKRTSMKKKEQLGEGYYPMGKKASYNDSVPQVKIILQHTRQIEEGEQRFRNIAKIFVENVDGERFLVPTVRPGLARVYARHVAEGGTPYDDKGRHITTLVEEYTKMAGFVRATRNGQFNESAQRLVTEGINHYQTLRETLTRMTSRRGYNNYFESYSPVLNEESTEETNLNELFVQETLDPRIESVMPILNRLSKNITEMSAVKELEEWAQSVTEVEDQTTKTLAEPADEMLDEAPGAETLAHNDATEKSNLKAFDLEEKRNLRLRKKSRDEKPTNPVVSKSGATALDKAKQAAKDTEENNPFFKKWDSTDVEKLGKVLKPIAGLAEEPEVEEGADLRYYYPSATKARIKDKIKKKFNRMEEGPADEPVEPDMDSDDKRWDDIEDVSEGAMKAAMHDDAENMSLKEFLMKYGDDDFAREFWHTVNGVDEGLDANQKRAGQLGPTEPVGKNEKNLRGKLVGASESVELGRLKALSGIK